jgi:hypothetical protein
MTETIPPMRLAVAGFLANHQALPAIIELTRYLLSDQAEQFYLSPYPGAAKPGWQGAGGMVLGFVSGYKAVRCMTKVANEIYYNADGAPVVDDRMVALYTAWMISIGVPKGPTAATIVATTLGDITREEAMAVEGAGYWRDSLEPFSAQRWIMEQTMRNVAWCASCS